jgi:ligand-binding SRPBCC domain-containing protein
MRILIKTRIKTNYTEAMAQFDRALFEALAPPFPKIEIVEFTGSKKGDRVHIRFLPPVNQDWISDITADGINEKEAYFIDEGVKMPFPLKQWRHKHIVEKDGEHNAVIIDDITYEGPNKIVSFLMYPFLYLSFLGRKPIYKRWFNK